MTRPDHPLLTKVLAEAYSHPYAVESFDPGLARELISAIPPDIADRLERCLDVCSECGLPDKGFIREGVDFAELAHEDWMRHPYVPLVEVPHD